MTQTTTPVGQKLVFKIVTPKGIILTIPQDYMPEGFRYWDSPIEDIAAGMSKRLGLTVTVEKTEICTSSPSVD